MREIVEGAMRESRVRTLRLIARDVEEMVLTLAPHEREGLEAILKAKLGYDSDLAWNQSREAVLNAVKRGRVDSEKERRRLERYAEVLEAKGGDTTELAALRSLLARS